MTLALGAAHSIGLLEEERVVCAFFGDGAMNRGPVLEALNWAAVYRLPVLFVCEDNRYAATTATASVTATAGIQARVEGFGIPLEVVDGNDVAAVARAAEGAGRIAARRRGPRFLHGHTYRARGHLAHDKAAYRPEGEADTAWESEPIGRWVARLEATGASGAQITAAWDRGRRRAEDAVEAAKAAPWPDAAAAFSDVQDLGGADTRPY